jgi:hypothetical protein
MQPDEPARPRWLFRGRPGAWDALAAAMAQDPSRAVRWPIAPSGPSMAVGDAVLLWRSGRGGGIAARCTVVGEPEAELRPGEAPVVLVELRIDRAFSHPVAPSTLARHAVLRPLAFMDLLDQTEHRVTAAQEEALATLLESRERASADDPDEVQREARTTVQVPVRLVPLVEELLTALGADEPAPAPMPTRGPAVVRTGSEADPADPMSVQATASASASPTDLQVAQAEQVARTLGPESFTVDDVAAVWRTGVGTARSRVERLVDSGLFVRSGTLRSEDRPGTRPTRGRPPVLYRLAGS